LLEVLEGIKSAFTKSVSSDNELMTKSAISSTLPSPHLSHVAHMLAVLALPMLMRTILLFFLLDSSNSLDFLKPSTPVTKLPAYPVHLFGPSFGHLVDGSELTLGHPQRRLLSPDLFLGSPQHDLFLPEHLRLFCFFLFEGFHFPYVRMKYPASVDSVTEQQKPHEYTEAADDVVVEPWDYVLLRCDSRICEYNVEKSKKYEESPDADARASNITLFNYSNPRS
jgi:hypothetical protein